MHNKFILIFFLYHLSWLPANAQQINAEKVSVQTVDMEIFVGFDGMGNIYFIKNNVFYKKNNKALWQYKNVSLGKITKIDIQNQLRIMLYYENFNTIILLDNQLNEMYKIDFFENATPLVASAAGIASQNRVWIYNSLTLQIGLFDYLKNTFQTITPSLNGNIKKYHTDFNNFWWIDEKKNYYAVDIFGKITNFGIVLDYDQIQIGLKKEILFYKDEKFILHDLHKNIFYAITNVDKSIKNFFYKDQILAIFTNGKIINYKITIP